MAANSGRQSKGRFGCTRGAVRRAALVLLLATQALSAQTLARKGWAGSGLTIQPWWQQAVFYQIDPISFQDASGDGFGDLRGIVQRLDYLQSLGVDAVVLSPFSLEAKFAAGHGGPAFDPVYGSADDLDQLIAETSRRHMRVLIDLPLDQAGSNAEAASAARFWFTRGVAGLHVVEGRAQGDSATDASERAARLAAVRAVVATSPGQRVLLLDLPAASTGPTPSPTAIRRYHRTASAASGASAQTTSAPVAELAVDRQVSMPSMLSAEQFDAELRTMHWANPGPALSGHTPMQPFPVFASDAPDTKRSFDRYNDSEHQVAIAKALATLLFLTRADPLLYFGQEIGMETTVHGSASPAASPGEPTPMQWGAGQSGTEGFSSAVPWMGMGRNAATANVAAENTDPDSLLSWYRRLSALRHEQASLREGSFQLLTLHTPGVLAWVRIGARVGGVAAKPVLVVVNLSPRAAVVPLAQALAPLHLVPDAGLRTLAFEPAPDAPQATAASAIVGGAITLPAYGAYAGEFTTQRGVESVATAVRRSARRGR